MNNKSRKLFMKLLLSLLDNQHGISQLACHDLIEYMDEVDPFNVEFNKIRTAITIVNGYYCLPKHYARDFTAINPPIKHLSTGNQPPPQPKDLP